jgi:hypothetical protein
MRPRQPPRTAAIGVLLLSAVIFWRTAYPTVTWWDSSSYSLAAATLGVDSPPGSLLLTLLGWPVTRFSFGMSPAHALNLFAGLLAAFTAMLVCVVAVRIVRIADSSNLAASAASDRALSIGAALGALTFAFSGTLWAYAVRFTPYVLSAFFTGLILWTMVRWWEDAARPDAWRWLAWLGLLFGLDFSVHRTNALLIPGAIVWILLRDSATLRSRRSIVAGAAGLVAGLAVQMLLIPIAAFTRSPLNFTDPSNLSRFWDYVTISQLGGSFLLQLIPRKSPIWSMQTADLLRVLGDNFWNWSGPRGVFGVLPALAALVGLVALWRRNHRLVVAFGLVLLIQATLTVLYFNIPANYFRTFDRHYLPVCVTFALVVACGLVVATRLAAALMHERRWGVAIAVLVFAMSVPVAQLAGNWAAQDASRRYFTRDYAASALRGLPPHAIYFTVGDNDTFPVMYLQSVEDVRPDVTIINLSVANIPEWPDQLRRRDPSFPLALSIDQRRALAAHAWTDTSVIVPVLGVPEHLGLASGTKMPASITLHVRPAHGPRMFPAEIVLLDIVRTNAWNRPLTFAITGTRSAMEWLVPYGRPEGLYFRILPVRDPPTGADLLRAHVLETTQYRGFADPTVRLDKESRTMGMQSYAALVDLLEADRAGGSLERCRADRKALLVMLPFERLLAPAEYREPIETACGETK